MSLLATFYIMPAAEVASLMTHAAPQKPRWFGKTRYPLWEQLRRWGDDILAFDFSGYVLLSLLEYLDQIHGIRFDQFAQATPVKELAALGYSGGYAFAHADAVSLLERLDGVTIIEEKMRELVNEMYGTDTPHDTNGDDEALRALTRALKQVEAGKIGLLWIA